MQDLVATMTVRLQEGTKKEAFDKELKETLEFTKGIRRYNSLELADGSVQVEIHIHGQTERPVADGLGNRVFKMLSHFDMGNVEYHGIEFPDEVQLAKGKWQGREDIDDVVLEHNGARYIRLDYYLNGLSFEDLGISDPNTEILFVAALQTWPKAEKRDAIRRLRDHYQRLEELRGVARAGQQKASRESTRDRALSTPA